MIAGDEFSEDSGLINPGSKKRKRCHCTKRTVIVIVVAIVSVLIILGVLAAVLYPRDLRIEIVGASVAKNQSFHYKIFPPEFELPLNVSIKISNDNVYAISLHKDSKVRTEERTES